MSKPRIVQRTRRKIIYQRIPPTSKENMTRRMIAADFPFEVIIEYGNINEDEFNALERANHELILEVKQEIQALFDDRRMWVTGEETGIDYTREIADAYGFTEEEIIAICIN